MNIRDRIKQNKGEDPRLQFRGDSGARINNMTDAVFGIAITLLIFNQENPNSFESLLRFTQTLPALLLSIGFIILIWREHVSFSRVYSFQDTWLMVLNTCFIGLVIFYVYPLRFLTVFLTNFFFGSEVAIDLNASDVPKLMIYYGLIVAALYCILYLLHFRAARLKESFELNAFEQFYTRYQMKRMFIMLSVPLASVIVAASLQNYSPALAGILGGLCYNLYIPAMMIWSRRFKAKSEAISNPSL